MHEESEDQNQGFYKPSVKIVDTREQKKQKAIEIPTQGANQLVSYERPLDFIPRIILPTPFQYSQTQSSAYHPILECQSAPKQQREQIQMLNQNRKPIIRKKFPSLKAKYQQNPQYQLIYSKVQSNSQLNSFIISLECTTDYNPNDYFAINPQSHIDSNQTQQPIFDSRFENGNLLYAFRSKPEPEPELEPESQLPTYDLIMQNDTNTMGYNQWFYFSYRNHKNRRVRINIVNFIKKHLMFQEGVRPVAYSLNANQHEGKGWHFIGDNIQYQKSYVVRQLKEEAGEPVRKNYYTLSFDLDLQYDDDTVYIALNYPYTYTMLNNYVDRLMADPPTNVTILREVLCHTISNNPLYCLRIFAGGHKEKENRRKILLMGRQHPGESVGSYVLENFITMILKEQTLLKEYQLVVIPMVNPDGVIYGNFRTNLAGFDLNRQWIDPNRWLHPQIYFVQRFINSLQNLQLMIDFHGHSKKLNSFIYACNEQNRLNEFRLYPYIFSQLCKLFSIKDCIYNITFDKRKTARVNVYNLIQQPYVYTLETGFYGYEQDSKRYRYQLQDFGTIAQGAVDALVVMLLNKKRRKEYEKEVRDKEYLFQMWMLANREDCGSESNPSEDELPPKIRKEKVMSDQKKLKKKKNSNKSEEKGANRKASKKVKLMPSKTMEINKNKRSARSIIKIQEKEQQIVLPPKPAHKKPEIKSNRILQLAEQLQKEREKDRELESYKSTEILQEEPKSPSNLLNASYYSKLQYYKSKSKMNPPINPAQEYSLQINCMTVKEDKSKDVTAASIIKKLKPVASQLKKFRSQSSNRVMGEAVPNSNSMRTKQRERIYIIKENKVVNSITRVHENLMRKNLEEQLHNRTAMLKNCQRLMTGISTEVKFSNDDSSNEFYKAKKLRPIDSRKMVDFQKSDLYRELRDRE